MILRVYAMWNQSKRILYILLVIYVPQVMVSFIFTGIYVNSNTYLQVTVVQVIHFSFCYSPVTGSPQTFLCDATLRFVLSATLLILAVFQTLKQSVGMYKATKQWQPNRYMQQLVRDGIFYFLVNVVYNISILLEDTPDLHSLWWFFLSSFCVVSLCPMMSRFIIGVRELYDRDLRAHWQGIDTGFGVLSQPIVSENVVVSAIAFAAVTPGQGQGQMVEGDEDDSEVIRLEVLGDGSASEVVEGGEHEESEAIRIESRGDGTRQV